jgi:hypothetical protein
LDVKDFIGSMSNDEQIQTTAKQIQFLQTKPATKIASPDRVAETESSLALLKLRELLPPRSYCDRLIFIYCNHFERTMRVLHIPTFMRQYEQLWNNINSDSVSPSFVPQLTAVMAMAYHMDDAGKFIDDRDHRNYLKGAANELIQDWLDELSRKQRTQLSTLQVEVLLLLAKSLRGMHPEKLWSSTGALVRSAMVMGINLDPSTIKDYAPYQAEMRRRLWATILEIDLQASIATGMPIVLPSVDSNSLVPSNLNDLDFDESSTSLPSPHSLDTYTDNIYQVILASSLPQRLRAVSMNQRSKPDLQEALTLGNEVEECINRIPQVVSLHNDSAAPLDGGCLLHRVLLDLYLRRPVLGLYKSLVLGEHQHATTFAQIHRRCLDYSMAILAYQDLYTLPALSSVTDSPMAHQNFFYRCCKMDVLWAALTCCQRIKVLKHTATGAFNGQSNHNIESLMKVIDNTINCLIDRIGENDSDIKDLTFLALTLRSVQLPNANPNDAQLSNQRSHALQQAVLKTLNACRERLMQPMFTNEPAQVTKHVPSASAYTVTASMITPPITDPRFTPAPASDATFPFDLAGNAEQWFEDFPGLAAEFTNFQTDMYNSNNALNFGAVHDWNWEHMWQ